MVDLAHLSQGLNGTQRSDVATSSTITFIFRKRLPNVFSIEKLHDELFHHFQSAGLAVRRLELPHTSSGIASVLRNAWYVARQRRKGILHITGDVHYAALLCPLSPTVITAHDCVVLHRGRGFKRWIFWLLWFRLPFSMAAAIAAVSEQTKRELQDTVAVPDGKITVIPNFVDREFMFSDRPFAAERPRILHIGTTPNKNLTRVIRALHGLRCLLVIVGPLPEDVRRDLDVAGVPFENHVGVDHAALRCLYQESDIISFPSTYEGFGMPIVEGQAVGRPVLTSDLAPMRDVAGVGGALLVDPFAVSSIRDGFVALMSDAALRAALMAAGMINCRRFSLQTAADTYAGVYRKISGARFRSFDH